jgi:hypothetical protein
MASKKYGHIVVPIITASNGRLTEQQAISVYLRAHKLQSAPVGKKQYATLYKEACKQDPWHDAEGWKAWAWKRAEESGLA